MARQRRTVVDLSGVLHMSSRSAYRRYEGQISFAIDEISAIASWLGVPVSQFLIQEPAS